ncbi:MAG: hypothetical protein HY689_08955 [Chloroflexi bacterium]|nr:hypothetical protein [Chloroflexota bacterium]
MLHMVIMRHSPESCPGRPENQNVVACVNKMQELTAERNIKTVGSWADPPAHVNYLLVDAPSAHVVQAVLMESGVSAYASTEVHPVISIGDSSS